MNKNNFNGLILLLSVILMVFILISNVSAVNPDNSTNLVSSNVSSSPLSEDNNVICDDSNNTPVKGVLSSDESDVIYISPEGNGSGSFNDSSNLENAIKHSSNNGTIIFLEGNYTVNSTQNINNDLIFKAAPNSSVFISSKMNGNIFIVNAKNVCFINLNFNNNNLTNGNVIEEKPGSIVNIENCTFNSNSGKNGGCIYVEKTGHLNVNNSNFNDNNADNGGCIYFEGPNHNLNLLNSNFTNNTALNEGGCVCIKSSNVNFNVNNCNFTGNKAYNQDITTGFGGVIRAVSVNITDSNFKDNAANFGGALWLGGHKYYENPEKTYITNSSFIHNHVNEFYTNENNGGAIWNDEDLEVTCSIFQDNRASGFGGAVYVKSGQGALKITNSVLINNTKEYDWYDCQIKVYDLYPQLENNWWGSNNPDFFIQWDHGPFIPVNWLLMNLSKEGNNVIVNFITARQRTPVNGPIPERNIIFTSKTGTLNPNTTTTNINNIGTAEYTGAEDYIISAQIDDQILTIKPNNENTNPNELYYGEEDNILLIPINDNNIGNVTVTINNETYNVTDDDNDGIITIELNSTLSAGNYTANYNYKNKDNISTGGYQPFTIYQATPTINTNDVNILKNEPAIITANVTGVNDETLTGNLTITLNNEEQTISINNGTGSASFNITQAGIYKAKIVYNGNGNYTKLTTEINIYVNENSTSILTIIQGNSFSKQYNTKQDYTGTLIDINGNPVKNQIVRLNLTRTTTGASKIYNVTTDENGTYRLPIHLAPGSYTITPYYNGENNYIQSTGTTNKIIVTKTNKTGTNISSNEFNHAVNAGLNFTGKLLETFTNEPIPEQTIYLNLTRTTTGASKIYKVTTNENGQYQLPINLAKGTYTIKCSYKGTNIYEESTTNNHITIN